MLRRSASIWLVLLLPLSAVAGDARAGKWVFRQQCALCHSAEPGDGGGSQGPNLDGVYGRAAAGDRAFSYTRALRRSQLSWDAATLDRYLAAPARLVPGTAMPVAVPDADSRQKLIAYFQAEKAGTLESRSAPTATLPPVAAVAHQAAIQGIQDWQQDAPGRVHRIDLDRLAPPYDTPASVNMSHLIDKPADAKLQLPPGFQVAVYARDLDAPRAMRVAPNGDVFVSEPRMGRIVVLRSGGDGNQAQSVSVFAQGLLNPFGMAFYPSGAHPRWLYVAELNRVVRYPYRVGDVSTGQLPEIVVPELAPSGFAGHSTRDIVFSPDDRWFYVSVGSGSNVAEQMPRKSAEELEAWKSSHALGASWGAEERRADVLVFKTRSPKSGRVYATGLRNCVGLTIQPQTGALWCTTNERDLLGDDLVPDYSTRVREGGYYGWPWYYMGSHEDPRLKGERPDLAGKALIPDVPYQAHSAPLNLVFYDVVSGSSVFPQQYVGDGFAVLHGSWNRASRTGYKVVRIRMKDGVPTGEYEDFMVGFIANDADVWGRPVGAAVTSDGALLISDDGANVIYRISYAP